MFLTLLPSSSRYPTSQRRDPTNSHNQSLSYCLTYSSRAQRDAIPNRGKIEAWPVSASALPAWCLSCKYFFWVSAILGSSHGLPSICHQSQLCLPPPQRLLTASSSQLCPHSYRTANMATIQDGRRSGARRQCSHLTLATGHGEFTLSLTWQYI
jgi:hypothetical protein